MGFKEYSWREVHEKPEKLSNAELRNAEEYAREEARRYPDGQAIIAKLNNVIAERERRERQEMPTRLLEQIADDVSEIRWRGEE